MSIFLDSPWPAILFGIIGEAVLAVMLLRSGRGVLLGAMAGVLALSLAGVGVERLVVTDNKLIAAVIYDAAAALEANDLPRAGPRGDRQRLHPGAGPPGPQRGQSPR